VDQIGVNQIATARLNSLGASSVFSVSQVRNFLFF